MTAESVARLVRDLNTGRLAAAVGVDRVKVLPGSGIRIQVGIKVFPKKATLFDAVAETIDCAAERNLAVVGLERQTKETFVLTLEPRFEEKA